MYFAIKNSLFVVTIGIIIATFLATLLLYIKGYLPQKLKVVLEFFVTLPLFLPPSVTGYFLLLVFGVQGVIGKFLFEICNIRVTFFLYGAIISGIVVSLPIVYQSINLAISSIEKEYIEEAILMGTNHFQMFRYIVFPMSKNGIIAGIILGMGRILGEFGATLMVAGNIPHKTQTIPTAIYSAVESGNDKEAMILILIAVWISSIIMWLYSLLKRKELKNQKNYPSYI